jgi:hypothetical protein
MKEKKRRKKEKMGEKPRRSARTNMNRARLES